MSRLITQLLETSPWELAAAALGLAYLMLAVRRSLLCWLCAFASTAIYLFVCVRAALYMQSVLQVFYLAMAVYGFRQWQAGRTGDGDVAIQSWPLAHHLLAALLVLVATAANGWLLAHTNAARPYLDSFVTWGSIVTTWMVARRVIENWLYWIVIDSAAAWLYFSRGLLVTTVLYAIYVVMVVHGYLVWRRDRLQQQAAANVVVSA